MLKASFLLTCSIVLLATAARAQAPDLTTPDVQKLKSDALAQRAEIVKQRTDGLRKLVDDQLESVKQALAKAKVSGNITATASGSAAVRIFTEVKAAFDRDGTYAVTGTIRHDLESSVEDFKRSAQAIEDKQTSELKKMNRTFATKLGDVLVRQKTPVTDETKLLNLWNPLMNLPPPPAGPVATGAAGGTNAAVALPASSAVLQTKGAAATWTPLMKLDVTVHDLIEVVSLQLPALVSPKSIDGMGSMNNTWQIQATPYQEFVPGNTTPAFRIQSLPPQRPLEVLDWPTARNNWTIELRANAVKVPSRHAVVLETDASACKAIAGAAAAPITSAGGGAAAPGTAAATAAAIKVRFVSEPDGAIVLVNNQPLFEQTRPLVTPFDYTLPANSPVDVTFRKRGYKDAALKQMFPTTNTPFRVTMVESADVSDITVTITADNSAEWRPTSVHVKKGNMVRFTATGQWSCGSGGEKVDANGYPNNDAYFKYYIDPLQSPRLSPKANYGALVARVLPDTEIMLAGKSGNFTATTDGEVALAINETTTARKDNKGQMSVRIMVDQ